jgi:hypothetical protein
MEPNLLKIIADNPALLESLRKLLESEFVESPDELGFSNERLGERVRARLTGLQAIDEAFKKILTHRSVQPKEPIINRAR